MCKFFFDAAAWRIDLPVQQYGGMGFAALLTQETFGAPGFTDDDAWAWKYIEFHTGAVEAYRSVTDPFELRSKHEATFFQYRVEPQLSARLRELKGLTLTNATLTQARVGHPYAQQLAASGGTEPYRWQVFDDALPSGLQLDRKSGTISGTPTGAGQHLFQVQVSDRSIARYTRQRQSVVAEFTIEVLPS